MKKLATIVLALVIGILPTLNATGTALVGRSATGSSPSETQLSLIKNSDFLGGFTENGIDYYVYGSGLTIDYIVADFGVVTDWSAAYLAVTDGLRIYGNIETTNGNFNGNGRLLWQ